jgi:hypothetical protein
MSIVSARWPWLLLAAVSTSCAVMVVVVLIAGPAPFFNDALFIVSGLGPLVVGVLLVGHRPGNNVGKLLTVIGSAWVVGEAARIHLWSSLYVESLPGTDLAAWLLSWAFAPAWGLIPIMLAVFPTGRVETAWLRWPVRAGLAVIVTLAVAGMVLPASLDAHGDYLSGMSNPWAIGGLADMSEQGESIVDLATGLFVAVMAALVLIDLVMRWRNSSGLERLQMRWFGLGTTILVIVLVIGAVLARLATQPGDLAEVVTVVLAINAVPAAIGLAVGRYRLYDIDRILSRTFTYALVAGTLVGVFAGTVIVLSNVLPVEDDLAVAAATLTVAALFNPIRKRVQSRVDRRFNRVRYDAQKEIEQFASRLRTELDLGDLTGEVLTVVTTTMQPTAAGVWIRSTDE